MRRLRSRVTLCRPSFALFTLQWHLSDPEEVLLTETRSKSCVMDDSRSPRWPRTGQSHRFLSLKCGGQPSPWLVVQLNLAAISVYNFKSCFLATPDGWCVVALSKRPRPSRTHFDARHDFTLSLTGGWRLSFVKVTSACAPVNAGATANATPLF
jgi:hypothetical protein